MADTTHPSRRVRAARTTAPKVLRRLDPREALDILVETEDGDLNDQQTAALGDAVRAALPPRP